jgi:hypothetical protein
MALDFDKSQAAAQWKAWHANQTPEKRRPHAEWTPGDFAIDQIGWLDSTVRNSGWTAILAYSDSGYLEQIINSLKAMGAHETLEILQRSLSCFPAGQLADEADERRKQVGGLREEDYDFLDSLDEEYYASEEDLCALAMKYWEQFERKE